MLKNITLIVLSGFILFGCSKNTEKEIDYGSIENGKYTNKYFNLTIKTPDSWAIQSQEAQQEISKQGASLISGDNKNLKRIIDESQNQSVNLFIFSKYEQGFPAPFNPSIASIAERVAKFPGIKRGSDYLFHAKKIMESGQIKYNFPEKIYSTDISGISFDVMPTEIDVNNLTIHQKYYAARIKDYALLFIISFSSDSEEKELNEIISKAEFLK